MLPRHSKLAPAWGGPYRASLQGILRLASDGGLGWASGLLWLSGLAWLGLDFGLILA